MNAMAAAQQAWDNAQPPDTSRQEREHELACKAAMARYLQTGDLPGREDASHVWGELEDDGSELILFDMLTAYRADNEAELLSLAKRVAGRVDSIVNEKIEESAMNNAITINTRFNIDEIRQEVRSSDDIRGNIHEHIMNLRDQGVREALKKLGWTPPGDESVQNQLCARDEELEKEKLELNEQLDALKEERDALARMQKFVLIFSASCRMADTDDCIEWRGNKDVKGYGRIHGAGGTVKAHRLAYCLHTQCTLESISGDVIRHTCDNPGCVNPRHLLIGSNLDNIADRVERDRSAKGEGNGWAKLTSEDVAQIKAFYQKGVRGRGAVSTAKRFNVCHSTVQRIISGERWAHHEDA